MIKRSWNVERGERELELESFKRDGCYYSYLLQMVKSQIEGSQ